MDTLSYILKNLTPRSGPEMPIVINNNWRRKHFPSLFRDLGFKVGVEVGVWRGEHAEMICYAVPGLTLFCVDPWSMEYNTEGKTTEEMIEDERVARERLTKYDCEFVKKISMEAVKDFLPNSVDFVYIDANHRYNRVIEDIFEWTKIVRVGGIVCGHDFARWQSHPEIEVKRAVTDYAREHDIWPWFVLGTVRNNRGQRIETGCTWFWVKGEKS